MREGGVREGFAGGRERMQRLRARPPPTRMLASSGAAGPHQACSCCCAVHGGWWRAVPRVNLTQHLHPSLPLPQNRMRNAGATPRTSASQVSLSLVFLKSPSRWSSAVMAVGAPAESRVMVRMMALPQPISVTSSPSLTTAASVASNHNLCAGGNDAGGVWTGMCAGGDPAVARKHVQQSDGRHISLKIKPTHRLPPNDGYHSPCPCAASLTLVRVWTLSPAGGYLACFGTVTLSGVAGPLDSATGTLPGVWAWVWGCAGHGEWVGGGAKARRDRAAPSLRIPNPMNSHLPAASTEVCRGQTGSISFLLMVQTLSHSCGGHQVGMEGFK